MNLKPETNAASTTTTTTTLQDDELHLKLPLSARSIPKYSPFIALGLQLLTITILIILVFQKVYLDTNGELSNKNRILYTAGTTILASAISLYTASRIKLLWILDTLLSKPKDKGSKFRRASSVVGIGSFKDALRYWHISISTLLTGLMTAAIVAGIAPTKVKILRIAPTSVSIPSLLDTCSSIGETQSGSLRWKLNNGSSLTLDNSSADKCGIARLGNLLSTPHFLTGYPNGYKLGATVASMETIGAPLDPIGGFSVPFQISRAVDNQIFFFDSITQCVPVLKRNPIRCEIIKGINSTRELSFNGCNISQNGVNITKSSPTVGGCLDLDKPGRFTILAGGTGVLAEALATVASNNGQPPSKNASVAAIACTGDILPAMTLREVTLTRWQGHGLAEVNFVLNTTSPNEGSCQPKDQKGKPIKLSTFMTEDLLVTASTAPLLLVSSLNTYGIWPAISISKEVMEVLDDNLSPEQLQENLLLPNSTSVIEDILGLATGLQMGIYWGNAVREQQMVIGNSSGEVWGVRVGTGALWALVFIIPEVYALAFLSYLLGRLRSRGSVVLEAKLS